MVRRVRAGRAVLLILAVAVATTTAAACRSEKTQPVAKAAPAPVAAPAAVEAADVATREPRAAGERTPVFWIGLDGLDWELMDRLSVEGKLPNWKRLIDEGWTAKLASPYPLISPILW